MSALRDRLIASVASATLAERQGRVVAYNGLVLECSGPDARLGELCEVLPGAGEAAVQAEVVGFREGRVLLMPYGSVQGISADSVVRATGRSQSVPVGDDLLGRVVDGFCRPLDRAGPIQCSVNYPLYRPPINPLDRAEIEQVLETGVRAVDGLLTMGVGQRIGVFAGSGVGKSTLLGMFARHVKAEVTVLALIGERGREVGDFIRNTLGEEGLKRSVVLVAAADEPPLVRTHAAHAAHAVAEYFRDQGRSVLLILDSMTRFAMAQREIGLAIGEPPTFRGYTPSVFNQLPRLVERCGRFASAGAISAIYSVLVEGDDLNEPVTDHMRAILDGHIVLSRDTASRGHFPAIDPLVSTSRLMSHLVDKEAGELAGKTRQALATYEASRDLIELGAYQPGGNPALDRVVQLKPLIDAVLRQSPDEAMGLQQTREALAACFQPIGAGS